MSKPPISQSDRSTANLPAPVPSWQEELRRGLELSAKCAYDHALRAFERAHEQAPERAETACALGREYMRRGQMARAEELLRAAAAVEPPLFSAGASLARCVALDQGRHEEGLAVLDELEARVGRDPMIHLLRGEIHMEQELCEEAALELSALRSMLEPGSDSGLEATARLLESRIENARGLEAVATAPERAVFYFKRSHDLDPRWAAPLSNLGATFEKIGRHKRAEQAYLQATALDAGCASAWHNLARLRRKLGLAPVADAFERAYYAEPQDPDIAVDYAIDLASHGRLDEAKTVLDKTAGAQGGSEELWLRWGSVLVKAGSLELSRWCLDRL